LKIRNKMVGVLEKLSYPKLNGPISKSGPSYSCWPNLTRSVNKV